MHIAAFAVSAFARTWAQTQLDASTPSETPLTASVGPTVRRERMGVSAGAAVAAFFFDGGI
jgi:hypothetical protein